MVKKINNRIFLPALSMVALTASSQEPVVVGKASYAPYPPTYKARTDEHGGFNATKMMTRQIYACEQDAKGQQRPIPTNDWWTDVINNRYSGALWSYPSMLRTSEEGVEVCFPTYWNENGTEVKSRSSLTVGLSSGSVAETRALDWHDWDVELLLPAENAAGSMKATLAHGIPFTWFEFADETPRITFSRTPQVLKNNPGSLLISIDGDLYALFYGASTPSGKVNPEQQANALLLSGAQWLSVALLNSEEDFEAYEPYAASIVRETRVDWKYDTANSKLNTAWNVKAENLREPGASAPVLQGFLPHVHKHADCSRLSFDAGSYLTPRGRMHMATSDTGVFEYSYRFSGMLPYYAAPDAGRDSGYDPEVLRELISNYATRGSFGGDTYWGGKGLTQMALNMTFAKETGMSDLYEQSKKRLKEALTDWLTYTPGEETGFFSYYPRWGGMLGFDVSYDSDAFNDHHFHYGYFIYASALLALEDKSFARDYGEILRMIVRDYANYDREDNRFPFLRTLDPWAGHSYAGGLGDHLNDNGNGQESSSEAMQGWGGVYLLGVALGDDAMRDAGIFGWLTESRATAEYWFDRDHIKAGGEGNYDYTLYQSPYNTNLTSKGIGWWTWFSGDSLWMHSIQWMPVSPCLNYLSEDLDFVRWDYETMRDSTGYDWFEKTEEGDPLSEQSVGNVVLCYMERYDPSGAAAIFDRALQENRGIARNADTGHISYFVIHNHLTYGDIDHSVSADIPTANLFRDKDGNETFLVYNPNESDINVTFRREGTPLRTVKAPAGLTAFREEAAADHIELSSAEGLILPAGSVTELEGWVADQYGARFDGVNLNWRVSGSATVNGEGVLTIAEGAKKGSRITVTLSGASLAAQLEIEVNDRPEVASIAFPELPDFIETGTTLDLTPEVKDQYGIASLQTPVISYVTPEGKSIMLDEKELTLTEPGLFTLVAECGGKRVEQQLKVFAPLPDLALGCKAKASSEENVGTAASNLTDGDDGSRWGSQHSDNQWVYVDLGEDCMISGITLNWEAAFASDYDLMVAPDGADLSDISSWTTVCEERGHGNSGRIRHAVSATGRYVKMQGLARATNYGYSLYAMEVSGIRNSADMNEVVSLCLSVPQTAVEGEKVELGAYGLTLGGERRDVEVSWSSDKKGEWKGNLFVPGTYGNHHITATSGRMSSSADILVEESARLSGVTVTPSTAMLLTGETLRLDVEGLSQFGGIYPLTPSDCPVRIYDGDGLEVSDDVAKFDWNGMLFRGLVAGQYRLDFASMAEVTVEVVDVVDANLAAGKRAWSSTSRDGNVAGKATDLDSVSRWESEWEDNQWIAVDLGHRFLLDHITIHWEGAYAQDYSVELSDDASDWHEVARQKSGKGGVETIEFSPVGARYVRISCHRRATGYGNSIREIEVHGLEDLESGVTVVTGENEPFVEIFTPSGLPAGIYPTLESARRQLQSGLYLIRRGTNIEKVMF
ncbi:MAG: hypothetical protein HDS26_04135 [Bacteroides sp.]|nr:hypothetical protein [Bacteroides sp.]